MDGVGNLTPVTDIRFVCLSLYYLRISLSLCACVYVCACVRASVCVCVCVCVCVQIIKAIFITIVSTLYKVTDHSSLLHRCIWELLGRDNTLPQYCRDTKS